MSASPERLGAPVTMWPAPSDEEAVAIAAAVEALWPRPVVVVESTPPPRAWKFSGRWWSRPVAARRDRPWY